MKHGIFILLALFACLAAAGGSAGPAQGGDKASEAAAREKEAVRKAIETSIKWCFPDKSRERLYGAVAHDSTYFMFQPDSRSTIKGFEQFREFSERVFMVDECRPLGSTIKDLRIVFADCGDVAWFSCLLDDWGEWAGEPWSWEDTRWTGVLQKKGERWVMMQQHFSNAEDLVRKQALEEAAAGEGE